MVAAEETGKQHVFTWRPSICFQHPFLCYAAHASQTPICLYVYFAVNYKHSCVCLFTWMGNPVQIFSIFCFLYLAISFQENA